MASLASKAAVMPDAKQEALPDQQTPIEGKPAVGEQPLAPVSRAGRKQLPPGEKAITKGYSFKAGIIQVLEVYARDHYTSPSQVITQAVRAYIPEEYFKGDS
jgi:hypothetical protein